MKAKPFKPYRCLLASMIFRVQQSVALAQQTLNTADGVALHVQQVPDGGQQREVFGAVVATATAALQRLDFRELGFPEPQHVLGDIQLFGSFADVAERVVCLDMSFALTGRVVCLGRTCFLHRQNVSFAWTQHVISLGRARRLLAQRRE